MLVFVVAVRKLDRVRSEGPNTFDFFVVLLEQLPTFVHSVDVPVLPNDLAAERNE